MIKNDCLWSFAVDRFLEPFMRSARKMTDDGNRYCDQDWKTESKCVCLYTVQCRVIVDNKCEFQQSSSHCDYNFHAALVIKTRKYKQTSPSEIRQNDLRSPTQIPHLKKRHVHISQSANLSKIVSSAHRFLFNQYSASARSDAFRSIHPERRSDKVLVYEHSQVLKYVRIHQIRHRAVVGPSSNRQDAISQCSLACSLHVACFSSFLSFSFASWSIQSWEGLNFSTGPVVSAFAPVWMFTTRSDNCLFCTSDVGSFQWLCDP